MRARQLQYIRGLGTLGPPRGKLVLCNVAPLDNLSPPSQPSVFERMPTGARQVVHEVNTCFLGPLPTAEQPAPRRHRASSSVFSRGELRQRYKTSRSSQSERPRIYILLSSSELHLCIVEKQDNDSRDGTQMPKNRYCYSSDYRRLYSSE